VSKSKIEWTDSTWNPIIGCSHASPGCDHCYAERMACRLAQNPLTPQYMGIVDLKKRTWKGRTALVESALEQPLKWRKPRRIFVGSMADLFHPSTPDEWLDRIFAVMALCPQHTFMVLTKRPERMRGYMEGMVDHPRWDAARKPLHDAFRKKGDIHMAEYVGVMLASPVWPLPNVVCMATAEDQKRLDERAPHILELAGLGWRTGLSIEPMLGPVDVTPWIGTHNCHLCYGPRFFVQDCEEDAQEQAICPHCGRSGGVGTWNSWMGRGYDGPGFDWIICGGESGPGARPMHPDWVRGLRDQCQAAGVPFFFKSWGEWAPHLPEIGYDHAPTLQNGWEWGCLGRNGEWSPQATPFSSDRGDYEFTMVRCGKAKSGRLLDGREWNEFPG